MVKIFKICYNIFMVNLITCNSYFQIFKTLSEIINETSSRIDRRNVIFCEAKISLMVERSICARSGGTFNTEVMSFGKYLLKRRSFDRVLTKEGSAMVIKSLLNGLPLSCLKRSKKNLAPSLYDLIIQLKSAKISPELIFSGALKTEKSVLKNKLEDIYAVYAEYEKFLADNRIDDQSSILQNLREAIEADSEIENANVFVVGYSGWTAQAREGISALMDKTNSFTAILTEGDNAEAFVNETSEFIRALAKEKNLPLIQKRINSDYTEAGLRIVNSLFTPIFSDKKYDDKIYAQLFKTPYAEAERVAGIIKEKVLSGERRYRDFAVAIPEESIYGELLGSAFETLEIPYFLDEKKKPTTHPLVTLILSYIEVKRKNLERGALCAFYSNPLFCSDLALADEFMNYTIKYNVNYSAIFNPFTFEKERENFNDLEDFRQKIVATLEGFDVAKLLKDLSVEEKLDALTERLKEAGEVETSAENAQMYSAVTGILDQINTYLKGVELSYSELKNVFLSGINALELSIIPQSNDAVFIGGYKEIALAKAEYLFAVGLTDEVPSVRQDVAFLSDGDIENLEEIKIKVEPKIKVVNHRTRESVALAMGAFSRGLFISCPLAGLDGKEKFRGEVYEGITKLYKAKPFPTVDNYLNEKQGRKSFAFSIGRFAEKLSSEINPATAYYFAVGEEKLKRLLDTANRDIKIKLENREVAFSETAPTTIEGYYTCPYRAFLKTTLRIAKRQEGEFDASSLGTLVHALLREYALNVHKVCDKETSDNLFQEIKSKIMQKDEFKKYALDEVSKATADRLFEEGKKYCYQTFLSLKNSSFKVTKTEARFGSDERATYPAISLNGGKIKLKGSIDRVDESDKYFRILDYKTGGYSDGEDSLFYGQSLQLYLYALAVKNALKDKAPAGLYYLPVSDKYEDEAKKSKPLAVGKSLDEEEALVAQDFDIKINKKSGFLPVKYNEKRNEFTGAFNSAEMQNYLEYALKISELASSALCDGVIVPSPMEDACKYCDYKGMCDWDLAVQRRKNEVEKGIISKAINGGEENGETD